MVVDLQSASFMQARGVCPSQVDEVIRGWGQYKDEVALLPSTEKDKIPQIAALIVTSFVTPGCVPLGEIIVIGHADKDFHGAEFETKVSKERATSVVAALGTALVDAFRTHKIGHLVRGAIAFIPTGVGATQPDPASARDRTLNRRVEIHIRPRGAPVPQRDTFERRIRRALKLLDTNSFRIDSTGQRKIRARCLLNKMLKEPVVEVFVDGLQRNRTIGSQNVPGSTAGYPGNYDGSHGPPLPDAEFMKLLGTVSSLLKSTAWDPTQLDDQILDFLDVVVLEKIYTGILQVEKYLRLQKDVVNNKYLGDRARIRCKSLYSDHFDDSDNIYNCWKGYTGGEDSSV